MEKDERLRRRRERNRERRAQESTCERMQGLLPLIKKI